MCAGDQRTTDEFTTNISAENIAIAPEILQNILEKEIANLLTYLLMHNIDIWDVVNQF